ncbi:MAG: hypothetical protein GJU73_06385 [Ferrovum sp.]|jgi:hypothetical protein|nr:hypothetical protein [Ferrovum sp.]
MRTWGKVYSSDGTHTWVEVTTDVNGFSDAVYLTALAQTLQLNLNESPFFANLGLPQQQTIITQVYPDYYVQIIQDYYSQFFAALSITRVPNSFTPTYKASILTHAGSIIEAEIPT